MEVPRVAMTDAAAAVLRQLVARHGPLLFHQSGGCCDGSAPMCFPCGEFRLGERDVLLGELDGVPFYIGGRQFEAWQHTQLLIDVVPGCGAGFSLEAPLGVRFLTRSRVFDPAEQAWLDGCAPAAGRAAESLPDSTQRGDPVSREVERDARVCRGGLEVMSPDRRGPAPKQR